ncbi:hypothetical protein BGX21_003045, partial [Mortierella sp. AD011]
MNTSGSMNSNNTKSQRVLGFLRKRSSPASAGLTGGGDDSKSIAMPSNSSPERSASPPINSSPNSSNSDSPETTTSTTTTSQHPIKNMIRRKSVELNRLLEGSAGTSFNSRRRS